MQDIFEPIELTAPELDLVAGGFFNNFLNVVVVADNGNSNGNLNGNLSGNFAVFSANGNANGNGNGNTVAIG